MNRIKIICTIGPATWVPEVMQGCIDAGMTCARVNGAFADPKELDKVRELVRSYSDEVNLMVDVKGPEVRMNKFSEPIAIKPGDMLVIGNNSESNIYPANYKDLYTFLSIGQKIVIGDGDVELEVKSIEGENMHVEVVFGEILKPGKAMNLPGATYASEVLTAKDRENLVHAINTGWDSVSASFIKDAKSARFVKDFLIENGGEDMQLIAKIEDQDGLDNIDEILEVVDGIMVARGGLGVELGLEMVPIAQRILIEKSNDAGKPVIVATQALESMISNPRPTRAEINDVETSVILGADSLMLSAESSAGKYPIEAVKTLVRASEAALTVMEPNINYGRSLSSLTADSMARAAAEICITSSEEAFDSYEKEISKVIVVSKTGTTARLISKHNINQPILAYVSKENYRKNLLISKGIEKVFVQEKLNLGRDEAIRLIIERAKSEGSINSGDRILLVCKTPFDGDEYFPNIFEILTVA